MGEPVISSSVQKTIEGPSSPPRPQEVVIVQNVNDNSAANFGVRLDGSNYQLWHKLMKVHISGVGKWGYVTGTAARPPPDSAQFPTWDTANSNVMGILLKSMTSEVMQLFACFDTAKEIWDSVAATYYDGSDFARIHELHAKSFQMSQNGQSVANFFASLKTIWQELDQRQPNPMTCAADINTYRVEKDKMRVHIFLNGLDSSLDGAKGELLRLAQPPTLEQAFAYVRKDEANRAAMKGIHTEVSSLTVNSKLVPSPPSYQGTASTTPAFRRPPPGFSDTRRCAYCKDIGHVKERCFKLNGYPASWKGGNSNNSSWRTNTSTHKSKAAVQLVQEPDFYGVAGQDHTGGTGKIGVVLHISDFTGSNT